MNNNEIQELIDDAIQDLRLEIQANLETVQLDIENDIPLQLNNLESRIDDLDMS